MEEQVHNKHKAPKQVRAEQTIENIFQAARELSISQHDQKLTSREVAKRSGYSVGTIYRYFKNIDDVFISIFMGARQKYLYACIELIDSHPPTEKAEVLLEKLVSLLMGGWSRVNLSALRFILKIFFKGAREPERFGAISDGIIIHLQQAQERDLTNTFIKLDQNQMRVRLRTAAAAIRSPFFEGDPIAGSAEHKKIALSIFNMLFANPKNP